MRIFLITMLILFSLSSWCAEIEKVLGEVKVNNAVAKVKMKLDKGDKVQAVGKKSIVVIRFEDGSKSLVNNGSIVIERLAKKDIGLSLLSGYMANFANEESKPIFEVKTKRATLGVRGTKFWLSESPEASYMCVCEGEVRIENKRMSKIVKRNQDVSIIAEDSEFKVKTATSMMWSTAVDSFEKMGIDVESL